MVFNTFRIDKRKKLMLTAQDEMDARNDLLLAKWEREAVEDSGAVEIINPGDRDHVSKMSFDFSQGWQDRAYKRLRKSREQGWHKPRQIIDHGTHTENVYESELDLEPFQRAECCVRCSNWQPDTRFEKKQLHARLTEQTGYRVPAGLDVEDCCCYCGARLDTQKLQ